MGLHRGAGHCGLSQRAQPPPVGAPSSESAVAPDGGGVAGAPLPPSRATLGHPCWSLLKTLSLVNGVSPPDPAGDSPSVSWGKFGGLPLPGSAGQAARGDAPRASAPFHAAGTLESLRRHTCAPPPPPLPAHLVPVRPHSLHCARPPPQVVGRYFQVRERNTNFTQEMRGGLVSPGGPGRGQRAAGSGPGPMAWHAAAAEPGPHPA